MRFISAAALTAGLVLAQTLHAATTTLMQDPSPGRQVEQSLKTTDGGTVPYLLYQPRDYSEKGAAVPLMLFLHGRGESNGPLSLVSKWGVPRRLAAGEHMKYLVVSPQCPRKSFWSQDEQQTRLLELLEHTIKTYNIDTDRIYLTGLSMGGYGTWRLAADHPEMFAAAAPICGKGEPKQAVALTNLPIWAWHGNEDRVVLYQHSVDMVDAIKAAGGTKVRLTSLEHIGHNSWQAAYGSDELYDWLDQQRASRNRNTKKK